jgi:lysophospholipase L1-like esterase
MPEHPQSRCSASRLRLAVTGITFFVIAGTFATAEWLARQQFDPMKYYLRAPGWEIIFNPSPRGTPDINRPAHIVANRLGFRGDMPSAGPPLMVAIGGSTTEDIMLNDSDTWVGQLQRIMRERQPKAWIGNMGKAGTNAIHHAIAMEKILPDLPHLDRVLVLVGLNDMLFDFRLHRPAEWPEVWHLQQTFMQFPTEYPGFLERLALYHMVRRTIDGIRRMDDPKLAFVQTVDYGKMTEDYRARRSKVAPEDFIREPPDMTAALTEYRNRLERIANIAAKNRTSAIFLTQPFIWKAEMNEAELGLIYAGGVGSPADWAKNPHNKWFETHALMIMLDAYNSTLLDLCTQRRWRCIDLARQVPKTVDMFYDDFHFSAAGAKAVAEIVARALAEDR